MYDTGTTMYRRTGRYTRRRNASVSVRCILYIYDYHVPDARIPGIWYRATLCTRPYLLVCRHRRHGFSPQRVLNTISFRRSVDGRGQARENLHGFLLTRDARDPCPVPAVAPLPPRGRAVCSPCRFPAGAFF